jgi:hypothetical protein
MADEPVDGHDDALMAQEQRNMTLSPTSQKLLQLLEDAMKKNISSEKVLAALDGR